MNHYADAMTKVNYRTGSVALQYQNERVIVLHLRL